MSDLFVKQDFITHAGQPATWKIECDNLSDAELSVLVELLIAKVVYIFGPFKAVYGIPRGGNRIAQEIFKQYDFPEAATYNLIVDDVYTTGSSMREYVDTYFGTQIVNGAVLFARGPIQEENIVALWSM